MTDDVSERLSEIRKRVEAATEGPWKRPNAPHGGKLGGIAGPDDHRIASLHRRLRHHGGMKRTVANAEFIASARSDVPYLLSLVEEVLEGRDQMHIQVAGVVNAMKATLDESPEAGSVSETTVRRWMGHLSAALRDAAQEGADDARK